MNSSLPPMHSHQQNNLLSHNSHVRPSTLPSSSYSYSSSLSSSSSLLAKHSSSPSLPIHSYQLHNRRDYLTHSQQVRSEAALPLHQRRQSPTHSLHLQRENNNQKESSNNKLKEMPLREREKNHYRNHKEQELSYRHVEQQREEKEEEEEEFTQEEREEKIRVVLRIRPPLPRELRHYTSLHHDDNNNKSQFVSLISPVNETTIALREHVTMPHGEHMLCSQQRFSFDNVFYANSSQDMVYQTCAKKAVHSVLHGFNATLIAYGQTGTGKTYTMEGFPNHDSRGIIPHSVEDIFNYIKHANESKHNGEKKRLNERKLYKTAWQSNAEFVLQSDYYNLEEEEQEEEEEEHEYEVHASYLQIYNEVISDLLVSLLPSAQSLSEEHNVNSNNNNNNNDNMLLPSTSSSSSSLLNYHTSRNTSTSYMSTGKALPHRRTTHLVIRDNPEYGVYVDGLSVWKVHSPEDVYKLLERGTAVRATASTRMSSLSSRSHAIFTLTVKHTCYSAHTRTLREEVGKLNLVDLAGSEKIKQSGSHGVRLEEAKCINKSLHALGNVISALAKRSDKVNTTTTTPRIANQDTRYNTNCKTFTHGKPRELSFLQSTSCSSAAINSLEEEEEEEEEEMLLEPYSSLSVRPLSLSTTSTSSSTFSSSPLLLSTLKHRKSAQIQKQIQTEKTTLLPHIPFRNSTLTNLLRDSLGGNCRTTLIACISPSLDSYTETLMTLQFASRAKHIHTHSHVNITAENLAKDNRLLLGDSRGDMEANSVDIESLVKARTKLLVASYEDKINALQCQLETIMKTCQEQKYEEKLLAKEYHNSYSEQEEEQEEELEEEEEYYEADKKGPNKEKNWRTNNDTNKEQAVAREMQKRKALQKRIHELERVLEQSPLQEQKHNEQTLLLSQESLISHNNNNNNKNSSTKTVINNKQRSLEAAPESVLEHSCVVDELDAEGMALMEHSTHIDKYKHLLLKQREMIISLNSRLTERDKIILHLQDEVEAYDVHVQALEQELARVHKENNTLRETQCSEQRINTNIENVNVVKNSNYNNNNSNNSSNNNNINTCIATNSTADANSHSMPCNICNWEYIKQSANNILQHKYDLDMSNLRQALSAAVCNEHDQQRIITILCEVISAINEVQYKYINNNNIDNDNERQSNENNLLQRIIAEVTRARSLTQEEIKQLQLNFTQERAARIRVMRMCNELESQIHRYASQQNNANVPTCTFLQQLRACWNELEKEMNDNVNATASCINSSYSITLPLSKADKSNSHQELEQWAESQNEQRTEITDVNINVNNVDNNNNNNNHHAGIKDKKEPHSVHNLLQLIRTQQTTISSLESKLVSDSQRIKNELDIVTHKSNSNVNSKQMKHEDEALMNQTMKLINVSLTTEIKDLKEKLERHVKDRQALQMIMEQRLQSKVANICKLLESLQLPSYNNDKTSNNSNNNCKESYTLNSIENDDNKAVNLINNNTNTTTRKIDTSNNISEDNAERNLENQIEKAKLQAQSLHKLVNAVIHAMNDKSNLQECKAHVEEYVNTAYLRAHKQIEYFHLQKR